MESIRAFVGYSFRDADSEVLAPILKYISRLAELVPNFSWQHAEHPEPRMVDEKVLELFADKNLYIGICTARERVIADEALTTQWWAPGKLNSSKSNFVWKTSDWIIQEIGVALGRDMHVILLIEEDTRVPGALQGNLEHVSFNRKSPEKCFDRLSGMIAALSPKVSNIQGTTKELPAAADQSPEKSRQPDNGDESFTPKADWKKRDYNFTLFNAIAYGTDQQVQNIQESFLASPFGGSEIDQKRWAAYGHFCRIITGKDGRLSELKEAADSNPNDSEIWGYLARSYLQYDEFASAAHAFERAANSAPAMAQRVKLLGEAAVASHQNRNEVDTNRLSDQIIALMETNNIIESNVLLAEKAIAEETRNNEAYIGTFERLLELDPSNADYRYSLAHKYSDLGMDGSSAFHYSKIPIRERNASVWNNLGVAFDRLGVEGLSVDAYRASERLGETLAMSNIALKYLSAGFLEEADAILKRAVVIPDHDKNVERAMVRVGTQTEAEQKKEAETFETAQKTSDFYRAFGRALVRVIGTGLTGTWKANECDVSATVTGRDFAAIGTYEVPQGLGFLSNAFLQTYAGVEQSKDRMRMEYRGIIHGRTIVGTVTRQKEGALPKATSILDSAESSPKMLMFLMDGDDSLSVLEQSGSAVRFYSLKKV